MRPTQAKCSACLYLQQRVVEHVLRKAYTVQGQLVHDRAPSIGGIRQTPTAFDSTLTLQGVAVHMMADAMQQTQAYILPGILNELIEQKLVVSLALLLHLSSDTIKTHIQSNGALPDPRSHNNMMQLLRHDLTGLQQVC
jgi:hypothetical protein